MAEATGVQVLLDEDTGGATDGEGTAKFGGCKSITYSVEIDATGAVELQRQMKTTGTWITIPGTSVSASTNLTLFSPFDMIRAKITANTGAITVECLGIML